MHKCELGLAGFLVYNSSQNPQENFLKTHLIVAILTFPVSFLFSRTLSNCFGKRNSSLLHAPPPHLCKIRGGKLFGIQHTGGGSVLKMNVFFTINFPKALHTSEARHLIFEIFYIRLGNIAKENILK